MVQAEKSEVETVEADMETANVDFDAHRLSAEFFDILCQHRTGNPMTVVLSGDAGNITLVGDGTPSGAATAVTPESAGCVHWRCCILASL